MATTGAAEAARCDGDSPGRGRWGWRPPAQL